MHRNIGGPAANPEFAAPPFLNPRDRDVACDAESHGTLGSVPMEPVHCYGARSNALENGWFCWVLALSMSR